MASESSQKTPAKRGKRTRRSTWPVRVAVVLVIAAGAFYYFQRGTEHVISAGTTFVVTRGPMEITVLEGGNVEAAKSQELKCEVEGQTKILSLVEEGSTVTPEDAAAGKVLVELDSKELQDKLVEQKLQFQNASATFTEAKEQYGIQVNQNESNVKAAELEVKFARLDLEKYLGVQLAKEIISKVETRTETVSSAQASSEAEAVPAAAPVAAVVPVGDAGPAATKAQAPMEEKGRPITVESTFISSPNIDFSKYADPALLGDGEARQLIRKLENDLALSEEEVGLAKTQMEGTQRLFEKDFVTKNDLDNDNMKLKRSAISQEAAGTSKELFTKYEFPKQAETLLSAYEEALRKLDRARRTAISMLAQAEAKLNSSEATYELQSRRLKESQDQIAKCVIRATKPGLVVYGSGGEDRYWRGEDRIEEGAQVRERQVIITIPDNTQMNVNLKVHESYVKRVVKGLHARVRVDAFPDVKLEGQVEQISILPDSENRWMNPDLKVYSTKVAIKGMHDWLKPGLSAEAEIIIGNIDDAIQVPLLAVQMEGEQQVCYVTSLTGVETRPVKTGEYNDTMIQVLEGLQEGEIVLLRSPKKIGETTGDEAGKKDKAPKEEGGDKAKEAAPAPSARLLGARSGVLS